VDGNIDSSTHEAFQTKVKEEIGDGARYILIDLSDVSFISSAGLRSLNNIFNQLRKLYPDANLSEHDIRIGISNGTYRSPHLKLLNLSNEARTAFEMAGFDMFIESFTDKQKAIASF
jgi:anti-anti-sigma regulatory factor